MKDGDIVEGKLDMHIPALDNEPDLERNVVDRGVLTELFVDNIDHIEVIS